MIIESMFGKYFLFKRFCLEGVNSRWIFFEELVFIQIVQFLLIVGGSDIDIDVIVM